MNCDAIAKHYAWMEFAVFGGALERCRTRFLAELVGAQKALVLGDGDGRFLKKLLDAIPGMGAVYLDCSHRMLDIAQRRVGNNRVSFYCEDALYGPIPLARYDLITTHFLFDCFEPRQLEQVIRRIAVAAPRARWVVSEFRVAEGWLARPSRLLIGFMYRFFGFTTGLKTRHLTDHRPLMQAAGFRLARCEKYAQGLLISELWDPGA